MGGGERHRGGDLDRAAATSASLEGRVPTVDEAIVYLDSLSGEARQHARDYIDQVPEQIDTPYRRVIKDVLGW